VARRGGLLEELKAANVEAQRERDRRRALKSWARARARGAVEAGAAQQVETEEAAPDRLERVSGEAAAELARKPEPRLKVITTPGGITFAALIVLLLAWPYVLPAFNASNFFEIQKILIYAMVVMGS
jgi:hypothetical protein